MTKPVPCYTIKVWCKKTQPFHKAGIRMIWNHRELGKPPTLWGHFGFYLLPKEAHRPMLWLKSIGFDKVELEEC